MDYQSWRGVSVPFAKIVLRRTPVSLSQADVVIVGAGVVGLTTALLLAAEALDVNITLLDANPPSPTWQHDKADAPDWDIRTSAITRFTQQIWESLGVWSGIQKKRLTAYADMTVQDAKGFGALSFKAADIGEPNLGHIIENKVILTSLWEAVLNNPAITVKAPLRLSSIDQGEEARFLIQDIDGHVLSTKLLIAADGPNSWVREQLSIRCDKTPYGQAAIITTVKTEQAHQFIAWQRFLPTGPLAFLPLSDPKVSSIVWTQPLEQAPAWCEKLPEEQAATLAHASDYCFGKVICLQKPRYFPLIKQHVREYVKPGLALVGDAAHVIHPLAGQGVNIGIKDAFILTKEICSTITMSRQPIGNYWALRRYERHRRTEVTEWLKFVGGLNTLFKSDSSLLRLFRSFGLNHLNKNTGLKNWLMQQALGI